MIVLYMEVLASSVPANRPKTILIMKMNSGMNCDGFETMGTAVRQKSKLTVQLVMDM